VQCRPPPGRARGWSGGRHCTAGQYGYVSLGRHLLFLVSWWSETPVHCTLYWYIRTYLRKPVDFVLSGNVCGRPSARSWRGPCHRCTWWWWSRCLRRPVWLGKFTALNLAHLFFFGSVNINSSLLVEVRLSCSLLNSISPIRTTCRATFSATVNYLDVSRWSESL